MSRPPPASYRLAQRAVAEAVGAGMLALAVVGSSVSANHLAGGNAALALLINALATSAALYAILLWVGPISGAHLNPLVSLMATSRGELAPYPAAIYAAAQTLGAIVGVALANALFTPQILATAAPSPARPSAWLSEFVATFGLIAAVWVCSRAHPAALAGAVAAYVGGAFFFTPTGFANPAVTLARGFTDTAAGISLDKMPSLISAQLAGGAAAAVLCRWLRPRDS